MRHDSYVQHDDSYVQRDSFTNHMHGVTHLCVHPPCLDTDPLRATSARADVARAT